MSDSVLIELDDGVLTVTLNEPDSMNALSEGVSDGLFAALDRASNDDDVRVMLLTGAGRGFCAGAAVGSGGRGSGTPSRKTRLLWPYRYLAARRGSMLGPTSLWSTTKHRSRRSSPSS